MTEVKRLAVDDLVVHCLQDGTFHLGRIPIQDTLGKHRSKPKCHDRHSEDCPSDPLYKNLLVKLYPNDDRPADLLPQNLKILDRNLYIGQLVKRGARDGYVSNITQVISARIYEPKIDLQKDPLHELYIYKKEASFFSDFCWSELEKGDTIELEGWIGEVDSVTRHVTIKVDFLDGTNQTARISQMDLLKSMIKGLASSFNVNNPTSHHFEINGLPGIFPGRCFRIPFNEVYKESEPNTLRWTGTNIPKPTGEQVVEITVQGVTMNSVSVTWLTAVDSSLKKPEPPTDIKSAAQRKLINVVSHPKPLKIGDIRVCKMENDDWENVMTRSTWIACLSRDYFMQRRRDKRPRLNEGAKVILPEVLANEVFVEIMTTRSRVDVHWCDGQSEKDIDAKELDPVRYTRHFPGAIIYPYNGRGQRFNAFNKLGPGITNTVSYGVVTESHIKQINFRDRSQWTVQEYRLFPGGFEPLPFEEPRRIDFWKAPINQLLFWSNKEPKIVVKRENSKAVFSYGCAIGMFTDGRVRVRDIKGNILTVWPTDLVPVNPNNLPDRSIFTRASLYD